MNMKRIFALAFAVLMVLALAACGTKNNDKMGDMSSNDSAMTDEPKNAEEALALHKKLLEQENAILSENTELWEKVFMEADKGMAMIEDGKNYGDFLLDTVEAAKEQFTDKEYEWLKEAATEISNIENKLTALEEKYPEIVDDAMNGNMMAAPDDGSMQKFPAFEGKDLDGKERRTVLRQRRHCREFLVHHLQSLRGRACRAGRAEQGACGEGRRAHRRQYVYA